jgi:hypothetical protein
MDQASVCGGVNTGTRGIKSDIDFFYSLAAKRPSHTWSDINTIYRNQTDHRFVEINIKATFSTQIRTLALQLWDFLSSLLRGGNCTDKQICMSLILIVVSALSSFSKFIAWHIFWVGLSRTFAQLVKVEFSGTGCMSFLICRKALYRLMEGSTQCPLYCPVLIGASPLFWVKLIIHFHPNHDTSVTSRIYG